MTGWQGDRVKILPTYKVTRLECHNVTKFQGGTGLQSWRVTSYKFENTS